MKNYGELMQDPTFAAMITAVEAEISEADYQARRREIELTDANVRFVVGRAQALAPGEVPPEEAPGRRKEALMWELLLKLLELRDTLAVEMELSPADWQQVLAAVQEHFEKHSSHLPGERDYLDFIRRYLRKSAGA